MNITHSLLWVALLDAALMAGCSTPTTRIRANPQAFASLPPSEQVLVREGRIKEGFDMVAVRLALGNPARIVGGTGADGQKQIWYYDGSDIDDTFTYPESSATPDPIHGNGADDSPRLAGLVQSGSLGNNSGAAETLAPMPDGNIVIEFRNGTVFLISH